MIVLAVARDGNTETYKASSDEDDVLAWIGATDYFSVEVYRVEDDEVVKAYLNS